MGGWTQEVIGLLCVVEVMTLCLMSFLSSGHIQRLGPGLSQTGRIPQKQLVQVSASSSTPLVSAFRWTRLQSDVFDPKDSESGCILPLVLLQL